MLGRVPWWTDVSAQTVGIRINASLTTDRGFKYCTTVWASMDEPVANTPDYDGQLGDGEDVPTVIESDGEEERCPYCGRWYSGLTIHWAKSRCPYPQMTERKDDLVKGLMCGDGGLNMGNNNSMVEVSMTNKTFLQWLHEQLGWVSTNVVMDNTSVQSWGGISSCDVTKHHDVYGLYTRRLPQFGEYEHWYEGDGITFPEDLSLTPLAMKMWYISDGGLMWDQCSHATVLFTSSNEKDHPDAITRVFEKHGITIGHSGKNFRVPAGEVELFFDLVGEAPPGFEYKWAWRDRDRYDRLKRECAEKHKTQTFEEKPPRMTS